MTVGGAVSGSNVFADQSIAGITVGSIADSSVLVGNLADTTALPDAASDFAPNPASSILAFTVKSKAAGAFSDTLVAAANIGKLALGSIVTGNGGSTFGVAAQTIRTASGTPDSGAPLKASKLDDPAGSLVVGDFVLRLL
jgi:hypothetical protein